ncbi:hypothetical protein PANO111632_09750 [Paracoccus nototheniae]
MRDHRLDPFIIRIGGGFGRGQHQFRVEDVQPLVFHGPHVEIIDGDDVEHVQIIFAAIDVLVPPHGFDQAFHRETGAVLIAGPDPHIQCHIAARPGGEPVADRDQIARDQREQIGGFRPGIVPFGHAIRIADRIAVRQPHRQSTAQGHAKGGHHVRTVGIEGDVAKTFGLALGAEHAAGQIQPLERGVVGGIDRHLGFQREGRVGQGGGGDDQLFVGPRDMDRIGGLPIDAQRLQAQARATVQHQILRVRRVARRKVQRRPHDRVARGQRQVQPGFGQPERPGPVIGKMLDGLGIRGGHGRRPLVNYGAWAEP